MAGRGVLAVGGRRALHDWPKEAHLRSDWPKREGPGGQKGTGPMNRRGQRYRKNCSWPRGENVEAPGNRPCEH